MRPVNPLRRCPGAGRKLYCVIIEQSLADGQIMRRPLRPDGTPGAFPDGDTRFKARKLQRRVRRTWPGAVLSSHRTLAP